MNISRILAAAAMASSIALAQQPNDQQADQSYGQASKKQTSLGEKMGFGIHGQFDYSFLHGLPQDWNGGDDEEAPSGIGFVGGIRGRIPMSPIVHFTPELNFHYARLVQEDEIGKRNFKQMDLEIPLMVRGVFMEKFYVAAGAQVGLDLSSKVTLDAGEVSPGGGLESQPFEYNEDIKKAGFGFGIVFGLGGYIMDYISIDLRVVMGITDVYPDVDSDLIESMEGGKQMSFRGGIGFWVL